MSCSCTLPYLYSEYNPCEGCPNNILMVYKAKVVWTEPVIYAPNIPKINWDDIEISKINSIEDFQRLYLGEFYIDEPITIKPSVPIKEIKIDITITNEDIFED